MITFDKEELHIWAGWKRFWQKTFSNNRADLLVAICRRLTKEIYEDIFQNRFPDKLLSLGSGLMKPILGGRREMNRTNNMVNTPVSEDSENL